MQLTLCYKQYKFELTLGAMKSFKEETGKDLQHTLLSIGQVWYESREMPDYERHVNAYSKVHFDIAASALYNVINAADNAISREEIEDGMFLCGMTPVDDTELNCMPYPYVLNEVALCIIEDSKGNNAKKKLFARSGRE